MKNTLKFSKAIGLSIFILLVQSMPAFAEKKDQTNTVTHYVAHTISQGLHMLGALGVGGAGTLAGLGMLAASMDSYNPNCLMAAAGLTTLFGSWAGSSYIVYKAPQWTDKYWLGYKTERTTKQNMICLASKIVANVFVPVGICAGEFISHLDGFRAETEQTDNK